MTSGTLMPNIVSELATVQTNLKEQESTSSVSTNSVSANSVSTNSVKSAESNQPEGTVKPSKLPYQDNHKVELLHLQAEIDALLQQLTNLKQQRLSTSDHCLEVQDSELHAVV